MAGNQYSFQSPDTSFLRVDDRVLSWTRATLTVSGAHDGKTVVLNRAAGSTVTLPAAKGTGRRFRFILGTVLTSNNYIVKVANTSDFMRGQALIQGASLSGFATANTGTGSSESDTITLNGSTTGGLIGDVVELEDFASNKWRVRILASGSGTLATPFSAAV